MKKFIFIFLLALVPCWLFASLQVHKFGNYALTTFKVQVAKEYTYNLAGHVRPAISTDSVEMVKDTIYFFPGQAPSSQKILLAYAGRSEYQHDEFKNYRWRGVLPYKDHCQVWSGNKLVKYKVNGQWRNFFQPAREYRFSSEFSGWVLAWVILLLISCSVYLICGFKGAYDSDAMTEREKKIDKYFSFARIFMAVSVIVLIGSSLELANRNPWFNWQSYRLWWPMLGIYVLSLAIFRFYFYVFADKWELKRYRLK